jgi:ribosomal protein L7/L12
MSKILNVVELRNDLIQIYKGVKTKKIGLKEAKELTNTAGKILSSAKLELEYKSYTGQKDKIDFLEPSKS